MSAPSRRLLNRALLAAIFGVVVWLVLTIPTRSPPAEQAAVPGEQAAAPASTPRRAQSAPAQVEYSGAALLIPVAGVAPSQLVDTFTMARGESRVHYAIDIMAPRGTPILAAAAGQVEKLHFTEGGGGIALYIRSIDRRWMYYYAHLDRYAQGLAEGQQVAPGAVIGFVGSTGNASPDAPHLHFAINAMAPGERWWEGAPVNPYPLLTAGRR